jgi:hypothetical protein
MSKTKVQLTLNSRSAKLDAEVNRWRAKQEAHIAGLIKATVQLKKLASSVRRLETKEAKLKAETAERRAAAKEARKALQQSEPEPIPADLPAVAREEATDDRVREARMKAMGFRPTKKGRADSKSPAA